MIHFRLSFRSVPACFAKIDSGKQTQSISNASTAFATGIVAFPVAGGDMINDVFETTILGSCPSRSLDRPRSSLSSLDTSTPTGCHQRIFPIREKRLSKEGYRATAGGNLCSNGFTVEGLPGHEHRGLFSRDAKCGIDLYETDGKLVRTPTAGVNKKLLASCQIFGERRNSWSDGKNGTGM